MNKKFTDDNYIRFIRPKVIENILKFHQSTIRIEEVYNKTNEYKKSLLNNKTWDNYFDIPESYIKSIPFDNLTDAGKRIINGVDIFLNSESFIYFTPIIIIKNSNNIPSGIYAIDFINKILYKFKEFNKKDFSPRLSEEDFNMCICYFIDLNKVAFLEDELGFINGIIQIGRIYEIVNNIAEENDLETFSKFMPQQSFTHSLGVNCRSQLFIKNQFLRDIK